MVGCFRNFARCAPSLFVFLKSPRCLPPQAYSFLILPVLCLIQQPIPLFLGRWSPPFLYKTSLLLIRLLSPSQCPLESSPALQPYFKRSNMLLFLHPLNSLMLEFMPPGFLQEHVHTLPCHGFLIL